MTDNNVVVYEVTLNINAGILADFDSWLTQHIDDLLRLPGFLAARILNPQSEPPSRVAPSPVVRRVVQYTLASQADLEHYLREEAPRMRAEGIRRFGQQFSATRRVLDHSGAELAIPVASLAIPPFGNPTVRCLNCATPLAGKYCTECGQQNHTYVAPLRGIIGDFVGNHFGFDTKFFRSILPLLFRPGFLSREYAAGRRVRYINPLRLYFFSSLLFFFLAWTLALPQLMRVRGLENHHPIKQSEQRPIQGIPDLSKGHTKQRLLYQEQQNITGTIFGRHFTMNKARFTTKFISTLELNLPRLMFVFLPLVAVLLKLFYFRSKRYYMEHLIFTLHNHALVFLAMLALVLASILTAHFSWLRLPAHYFKIFVGWYIVVYIFLAMLFYYRQTVTKTLVKFLLIGFIYWTMLTFVVVLGVMLTFTEVVTY